MGFGRNYVTCVVAYVHAQNMNEHKAKRVPLYGSVQAFCGYSLPPWENDVSLFMYTYIYLSRYIFLDQSAIGNILFYVYLSLKRDNVI